jgi:hypothetical protein
MAAHNVQVMLLSVESIMKVATISLSAVLQLSLNIDDGCDVAISGSHDS